jgi:four helix bundle protein
MKNETWNSRVLCPFPVRNSLRLGKMADNRRDIQERAFAFACTVIEFCDAVSDPRPSTRHLVQQLFKAGTSIGANLEEAAAGQTKPDFIAKAFVSLKEAREARYWVRLIAASRQPLSDPLNPLLAECEQLIGILTAILRTARASPDRGQ